MATPAPAYKRHRFPPAVIAHAVWLYLRFDGASLTELDPADRMHDRAGGVLIEAVRPGSTADRHGLEPGDVIRTIDQVAVAMPDDLMTRVRGPEGALAITLKRRGQTHFLVLPSAGAEGLRGDPAWGDRVEGGQDG